MQYVTRPSGLVIPAGLIEVPEVDLELMVHTQDSIKDAIVDTWGSISALIPDEYR